LTVTITPKKTTRIAAMCLPVNVCPIIGLPAR
jgi:hypothetical protein